MKTFYSILLAVIFIMKGDAQSAHIQPGFGFNDQFSIYDTTDISLAAETLVLADSTEAITKVLSMKKSRHVSGVASFYSKSLEGTKTATGEIFRHAELTAASNSFALNTVVKVTNLRNKKSVIVRINDRMHPRMAKKGRVVDLTTAAAKKIGLTTHLGLAKVEVEIVEENIAGKELASQ